MVFKDRQEAGQKLTNLLFKDNQIKTKLSQTVVISLLRGGAAVGMEIARELKIQHLPIVVAKVPAPNQPELAIGALCRSAVFLNQSTLKLLDLDKKELDRSVNLARRKQAKYEQIFDLKTLNYRKYVKNKYVIITDDGVATGATVKATLQFVRSCEPNKIFLAVPVAPTEFRNPGFDKLFILHRDSAFAAVSQFYHDFPQISNNQIKKNLPQNLN